MLDTGLHLSGEVSAGSLLTLGTVIMWAIKQSNRIAIMESKVNALWQRFLGQIGSIHRRRSTDADDNGS